MKKIQLFAVSAIVSAIVSGCSPAVKVETMPHTPPVNPAGATFRTVTQADANFSVSNEVNTKLKVGFTWTGGEDSFSRKLAERLAGRVVIDNAELLRNDKCDVAINIAPEFELVDKSGSYYRVNCTQIIVSILANSKIYAMTAIEPKAQPRKLGINNAKNQYLNPALKELVPFLKNELTKLSNNEIAVSILDFSLENVQEHPGSDAVAKRIDKLVHVLNTTPGIVNYLNIRQDVSKATCSFRVVYLKNHFPQGLANVINLKLAGK